MNNQNQLNGIDPKLQERFHAVMNTPTNANPNSTPAPAQAPIQTPASQPLVVAAPSEPTPAPVAPTPSSETTQANMAAAALPQMPGMQTQSTTPPPVVEQKVEIVSSDLPPAPQTVENSQVFSGKKQKGKISPVIVVLGTAVFLVIYTIVWVKVFNLSLPFLP